jgi:hypothetical protein
MKTPIYAIINGKAVKAVRTWRGKLEVHCYVPKRDEFELAMQYTDHLYFPTATQALDTDIVSKSQFKEFVAELQRNVEERHQDKGCGKARD